MAHVSTAGEAWRVKMHCIDDENDKCGERTAEKEVPCIALM
jgi:hypothetical protein